MKIKDVTILNCPNPPKSSEWWKEREDAPNEPNSIDMTMRLTLSHREYMDLLDKQEKSPMKVYKDGKYIGTSDEIKAIHIDMTTGESHAEFKDGRH